MYKMTAKGWLKHWDFLLVDFLTLEISFLCAYIIRHGLVNPYVNPVYRNMAIVLVFIEAMVVFLFDSFRGVLKRGYYVEATATLRHAVMVILVSVFYLFLTQEAEIYSRVTMIVTLCLYAPMSYGCRLALKHYMDVHKDVMLGTRLLLIMTSQAQVETVVRTIEENNYERLRIVGICVVDQNTENRFVGPGLRSIKLDEVVGYVCRNWIDELLVNIPPELPLNEDIINQFVEMGVTVHINLDKMARIAGQKQEIEHLGGYNVISASLNMATPRQLLMKRALDICGGIVGCLCTGILFLFVAPCIYIQSPGPAFFSQIRVGRNGKKFKLYKFRSMYMDAERRKKELMEQNRISDGRMFKIDNDPRIIGSEKGPEKGLGNFIRRTSIDEFPQFYNVLKGDMSLVGTRPPTVDEWEKYELHHRARLAIKPGITGLWQVSGRSTITDFEEVVKLDKKYIEEWKFATDIRILLKTVCEIFVRNGSM